MDIIKTYIIYISYYYTQGYIVWYFNRKYLVHLRFEVMAQWRAVLTWQKNIDIIDFANLSVDLIKLIKPDIKRWKILKTYVVQMLVNYTIAPLLWPRENHTYNCLTYDEKILMGDQAKVAHNQEGVLWKK